MHDEYRLETVVLNTLIPLPSYLFSPRARLPLGLHVLGSLSLHPIRPSIVKHRHPFNGMVLNLIDENNKTGFSPSNLSPKQGSYC